MLATFAIIAALAAPTGAELAIEAGYYVGACRQYPEFTHETDDYLRFKDGLQTSDDPLRREAYRVTQGLYEEGLRDQGRFTEAECVRLFNSLARDMRQANDANE